MNFSYVLTAVVAFGAGVAAMDTAQDYRTEHARVAESQAAKHQADLVCAHLSAIGQDYKCQPAVEVLTGCPQWDVLGRALVAGYHGESRRLNTRRCTYAPLARMS